MESHAGTTDRVGSRWMAVAIMLVALVVSHAALAAPYRHAITMDGVNDFNAGEVFLTTNSSYTAYVTWDDSNLYLGYAGPDIVWGNSTTWLLFYLDPDLGSGVGSGSGRTYNTQQPAFPTGFSPKYLFAWRVDEGVSSFYAFVAASWSEIANPVGEAASSLGYVELQVPLGAIDSPTTVGIVACLVEEALGSESTYAGLPSSSFADGYDPDFAYFITGDFTALRQPNDRIVLRVPLDYPTIGAAINASYTGDTVIVAAGTYTGPNNRDLDPGTREIVIRGVPDETTIDCENLGGGFLITGGQTTAFHIIDVIVTRAEESGIYVEDSSPWIEGGAVTHCASAGISMVVSGGKIERCRIANNSESGISLYDSNPQIKSCTIQGNQSSGNGGGIQCNSSNATIEGCEITGNVAAWGGAGINVANGNPLIKDCQITGNQSPQDGGGIYLFECTSTIQGCTISRNSADEGAGVYCDTSDPDISTSILWGNCATVGSEDLWTMFVSTLKVSCSDFDPNGIGPGEVSIEDNGVPNIHADPLFCNMGPCGATSGDFTLATASPCLAQSCSGRIGAHGSGCSATPIARVTWGRVKGMYR
jgi:parallel beta-helix repeat protein